MENTAPPNRWRRYSDWDARPLRLDRFACEDPANGFAAFKSPSDPLPGLEIASGRIASMDGVPAHDFDMIDAFIAEYHLDPAIAPEAMAMDSGELARMLVDMHVPRERLVRLAHGMTPAKLADVVRRFDNVERLICGHVHRPIHTRFAGTIASVCPSPAHQVALDLREGGPSAWALDPPAFQLHRFTPQIGLVSHLAFVDDAGGSHPFYDASGALID